MTLILLSVPLVLMQCRFVEDMLKEKTKRKIKVEAFNQTNVYEASQRVYFTGKAKVVVNETILAELIHVETLKNLMQKAVEQLKEDLIRHVSLRSSTGAVLNFLDLNHLKECYF